MGSLHLSEHTGDLQGTLEDGWRTRVWDSPSLVWSVGECQGKASPKGIDGGKHRFFLTTEPLEVLRILAPCLSVGPSNPGYEAQMSDEYI